MGRLAREDWIKVILPPKDKYFAFQGDKFFSIFSKIGLQTNLGSLPRYKGRPKKEEGKVSNLQPMIAAKRSKDESSPEIPSKVLLERFTLRPETASKHLRMATTFLWN